MRLRHSKTGAVLLWMASLSAAAPWTPAVAAEPVLKTTKWIVNWDVANCQLIRAGLDNPIALKIAHYPANETVSVILGNRNWSKEPSESAKELEVVLLPSGEKFSGPSFSARAEEGAFLAVSGINDRFISKLSVASGIAIELNGHRLIEMNFPTANAATEQLRKCGRDLLSAWGIDAAAMAALKQKAVPMAEPWTVFSYKDYPDVALRLGIQGAVIARIDIDKDGIVTDCVAMEPKPDSSLVTATCSLLKKRLKYQPAVGADDRPVATRAIVGPITWSLPGF